MPGNIQTLPLKDRATVSWEIMPHTAIISAIPDGVPAPGDPEGPSVHVGWTPLRYLWRASLSCWGAKIAGPPFWLSMGPVSL